MKKATMICNVIKKVYALFITAVVAVCCFPAISANAAEEYICEYKDFVDAIGAYVNEARVEAGLNPLYVVPVLNEVADVRAEESLIDFSHTRLDGTKFYSILDEYTIDFMRAGENLAAGSDTPEGTFSQWKNSETHWHNIMNEKYTHIGIGIYYAPEDPYQWYWSQMFVTMDGEMEGQYMPELNQSVEQNEVENVQVTYGDLDGDDTVTSFDLTLLIKYLSQNVELTEAQVTAADCMNDGSISIADAIVLKKYILRQYDSLPVMPN